MIYTNKIEAADTVFYAIEGDFEQTVLYQKGYDIVEDLVYIILEMIEQRGLLDTDKHFLVGLAFSHVNLNYKDPDISPSQLDPEVGLLIDLVHKRIQLLKNDD